MDDLILYHGSQKIVNKPEYKAGYEHNDYGHGFYMTEHIELAKEWAVTESDDGFVNKYSLNTDGFKILNLSEKDYNILHWLALLVNYRQIRFSTPIMKEGAKWLISNYLILLDDVDMIIGYRADDSYFSFARSFLSNEISLEQLSRAMRLGKLGEQYVLKSKRAFDGIKFIGFENCDSGEYYAKRMKRDSQARAEYQKEAEQIYINGVYIRDLIRKDK